MFQPEIAPAGHWHVNPFKLEETPSEVPVRTGCQRAQLVFQVGGHQLLTPTLKGDNWRLQSPINVRKGP
jgi:hypothetical protein